MLDLYVCVCVCGKASCGASQTVFDFIASNHESPIEERIQQQLQQKQEWPSTYIYATFIIV